MRTPAFASLLFTLCFGLSAAAQAPGPNPGVKPIRQIDRAEVRVTRVELAPGAIRSVHQHDDVRFHLFIPITGTIELTIGSAAPIVAVPGAAYFIERGTPHGFRNRGSSPAMVMEVFVKNDGTSAAGSGINGTFSVGKAR